MKSQLVILAAGVGSRLNPLTIECPKTMVKVNSRPMIDYILNAIDVNSFEEIIIAVGHKKEIIMQHLGTNYKSIPIRYVYNPMYKETNSIYSIWLLREFVKKDFIVINADTIFEHKVLDNIMNAQHAISVSVDDIVDSPLDDDAMKVTIKDNKIIDIRKTITANKTMGDAIGIYRFKDEGINHLFNEIDNCLKENVNDQLFTHAVNNLTSQTDIFSVSTGGYRWFEIDSIEDLKFAEEKLKKENIFREDC